VHNTSSPAPRNSNSITRSKKSFTSIGCNNMPYLTATSLLHKHKPMTKMRLMFDQWKFCIKLKKITSNGVHPNILWQHYLITIVKTKIYMKLDYSLKISIQIHSKFVLLCSETKTFFYSMCLSC
jgi:hypothetical protein